jgi:putative spermidine/putrescine transport system permease protein
MKNSTNKYAVGALASIPFFLLTGIFMIWPALTIVFKTFITDDGIRFDSIGRALTGTYQDSFWLSIQLSFVSSVVGGIAGLYLALLVGRLKPTSRIRILTQAWSAVASQMGGVPLAFAFLSLLGTQGLLTKILNDLGLNIIDAGFSLSSFWGWVLVYCYFQIPLMFLIVSPAMSAMKPSWLEGATSLGASTAVYWRRIGLPILSPVLLTGLLLLFVNSFAAYATVYALSSGAGQLVPLQIRFILQGNVITGQADLGYALVTVSMALLLVAMVAITLLQRKFARWADK